MRKRPAAVADDQNRDRGATKALATSASLLLTQLADLYKDDPIKASRFTKLASETLEAEGIDHATATKLTDIVSQAQTARGLVKKPRQEPGSSAVGAYIRVGASSDGLPTRRPTVRINVGDEGAAVAAERLAVAVAPAARGGHAPTRRTGSGSKGHALVDHLVRVTKKHGSLEAGITAKITAYNAIDNYYKLSIESSLGSGTFDKELAGDYPFNKGHWELVQG